MLLTCLFFFVESNSEIVDISREIVELTFKILVYSYYVSCIDIYLCNNWAVLWLCIILDKNNPYIARRYGPSKIVSGNQYYFLNKEKKPPVLLLGFCIASSKRLLKSFCKRHSLVCSSRIFCSSCCSSSLFSFSCSSNAS